MTTPSTTDLRTNKRRILISAGEASGDMYGAQLIQALRRRRPALEFFGVGGPRMREAGCDTVIDAAEIAVVGISEIMRHLPRIYGRFRDLRRAIDERRPAAGVVIDSPAFNLRVARALHQHGVPVFYYVAPQFWAWRQWRTRIIRKYVRRALVIFPFEQEFFRRWGVDAEFVGHPLAELQPPTATKKDLAEQYSLDSAKPWITLMPGSRPKEIKMNLPAMLDAASRLGDKYEFLLPVAPTLTQDFLQSIIASSHITPVVEAHSALVHSRAAVVASGTATVEAAMMGTPLVMVYRVSPITFTLGRPLVRLKHFAMVNLIAGEEIVPELVQSKFTAENIVAQLQPLLDDGPRRQKMLAGLAQVREQLRSGTGKGTRTAAERAADTVLAALS